MGNAKCNLMLRDTIILLTTAATYSSHIDYLHHKLGPFQNRNKPGKQIDLP